MSDQSNNHSSYPSSNNGTAPSPPSGSLPKAKLPSKSQLKKLSAAAERPKKVPPPPRRVVAKVLAEPPQLMPSNLPAVDDDPVRQRSLEKKFHHRTNLPKGTEEWIEERIRETEKLLSRRKRTQLVVTEIRKMYGVGAATVYKDIEKIHKRWQEESEGTDKETRRLYLRIAMEDVLNMSLEGQSPLRDENGHPLLDPATGLPIMIGTPNFNAAARLLDTLAKLDGLYQFPLEIKVQENVEKLLDSIKGNLTPDAYAQVVRAIATASGVSPTAQRESLTIRDVAIDV